MATTDSSGGARGGAGGRVHSRSARACGVDGVASRGGDDDSDADPDTVIKPERPEAMSEPTTDGAIAAATYFLQLYDYAFSARDAESLLTMSAEECKFCNYVDKSVGELVGLRAYISRRPPYQGRLGHVDRDQAR